MGTSGNFDLMIAQAGRKLKAQGLLIWGPLISTANFLEMQPAADETDEIFFSGHKLLNEWTDQTTNHSCPFYTTCTVGAVVKKTTTERYL